MVVVPFSSELLRWHSVQHLRMLTGHEHAYVFYAPPPYPTNQVRPSAIPTPRG